MSGAMRFISPASDMKVGLAAELLEQFYGLVRKGLKVFSSDFAFGLRVLEGILKNQDFCSRSRRDKKFTAGI